MMLYMGKAFYKLCFKIAYSKILPQRYKGDTEYTELLYFVIFFLCVLCASSQRQARHCDLRGKN